MQFVTVYLNFNGNAEEALGVLPLRVGRRVSFASFRASSRRSSRASAMRVCRQKSSLFLGGTPATGGYEVGLTDYQQDPRPGSMVPKGA